MINKYHICTIPERIKVLEKVHFWAKGKIIVDREGAFRSRNKTNNNSKVKPHIKASCRESGGSRAQFVGESKKKNNVKFEIRNASTYNILFIILSIYLAYLLKLRIVADVVLQIACKVILKVD